MRKLSIFVALVASTTAVACSFQLGTPKSTTPQPGAAPAQPAAPGAAPAAAPAAPATGPAKKVVRAGQKVRLPSGGGAAPEPATPPAGIPVLAGANIFGSGTPDAAGWKGSFFVLPPATQKLPQLSTMTPKGFLFAKDLNIPSKAMSGGFPGIDATRNEDFAIRWEAPLIVENEADYTFRLVSDDGANLLIDSTLIVDNDGQHTVKEKSGPVHLVKGTHVVNVDYFQATGPVALQLFCTKAGAAETICPTKL